MQKVLAIFAHPDDEAFGPGGTIAKWVQEGKEIHLLCVTKGEAGTTDEDNITATIRSQELQNSAAILGIKSIHYLDFIDGEIGNKQMIELEKIISAHIQKLQPNTLLTFNLNGVSGHLDHIAVASATTKSFEKSSLPLKLYYYTERLDFTNHITDYFVYFPPGITPQEADEIIDTSEVWDIRVQAMHCHKSQQKDIDWILQIQNDYSKEDFFIVRTRS